MVKTQRNERVLRGFLLAVCLDLV